MRRRPPSGKRSNCLESTSGNKTAKGNLSGQGVIYPRRVAVSLCQRAEALNAQKRKPGPDASLFRGLQKKRTGTRLRELTVERNRRITVGKKFTGDGDDPATGRHLLIKMRLCRLSHTAHHSHTSPPLTASGSTFVTAGTDKTSKHDSQPV